MLWPKKLIVFSTFILMSLSHANAKDSELIKKAALEYQKGFDLQKTELIKKNTTQKHFKELNKNDLLKRLFKLNKIEKEKNYLIKVTQSKVVKGMILAELIDKNDEENKKTLKLKKTDDGYKVDALMHMDE